MGFKMISTALCVHTLWLYTIYISIFWVLQAFLGWWKWAWSNQWEQ